MLRLVAVLAITCLLLAGSFAHAQDRFVDLSGEPGWLPYQFNLIFSGPSTDTWRSGWLTSTLFLDINGDGVDDRVRANNFGISLVRSRELDSPEVWQTNFPPEFTGDGPSASVDGVWDIDGDGRLELVCTASTADGSLWRVQAMDLVTGEIHSIYDLEGGPDHRPDGHWDGHFRSFGVVIVPTETGPRHGLVVASEAGFDLEPRGVRVLDTTTGEVLWEFLAGPKIHSHNIQVIDLDGDGSREILFLGTGVNNLGGKLVNGTSDDHAMIFALNADGSLAWSHRLGAAPAGGLLGTFDVEGDGLMEAVVTGYIPELSEAGLAIYGHDGTLRFVKATGGAVHSLLVTKEQESSPAILVTQDSVLRKFLVRNQEIELVAEARFDGVARAVLSTDMTDHPGREILIGCRNDRFWLLDEDLDPLATHLDHRFQFRPDNTFEVAMHEGRKQLFTLGSGNHLLGRFEIEANHRDFPWAAVLSVGGVGGGALIALRRRRKPHSKGTVRELRLQLLGRLKLSGHGAIGALSSLRRMIWHLDTLMQGFEPDAQVHALFRDLSEDTLRVGLPNLQAAVELAELAQMDGDEVQSAAKAIGRLEILLEGLTTADFDLDAMAACKDDLQSAAAEADLRFRNLRHLVEEAFHAEPAAIIERSLAAHDQSITKLEVEVEARWSDAPACQVDEEELAFVLDNLIENAIRAMHGSPERRLRLTWDDADEHIVLLIQDTGCGIAPDERELILIPGHSKRQGGGLGLPRSLELLAKYGGGLTVKESHPGKGTTMAVLVPRAQPRTET